MIGKELLDECKAQLDEQAKTEVYKDEPITFNLAGWEKAQVFANILIENGYEVSIGPISLERVRRSAMTPVTIFNFHSKEEH